MRNKIVLGNWKMNMTREETKQFLTMIKERLDSNEEKHTGFAVPFTDLDVAKDILKNTNVSVAAQNVYFEARGAYTGEISVEMLKELGVTYCLVGHSERRKYFAETDETVNSKVKVLLEGGIKPVVCVGENIEERNEGKHLDLIRLQVKMAIADVDIRDISNVIIAYEPLWAIGTGVTATPEQAEEICSFIRYIVAESYGISASEDITILYGGSVNETNAESIFDMKNIDGALVGGASLKPTFVDIVKAITK